MITITELAETKLVRTLEALRINPGTSRALHFKFSASTELANKALEIRPLILESITRHLPDHNGQIFWCEDGDVYVVAHTLPTKEARTLMMELAGFLLVEVNEQLVSLYECNLHIGHILALLDVKAEKRRKDAAAQTKKQEELLQQKKRQQILSSAGMPDSVTVEIQNRRNNRAEPEIMIIEDDTFSRKLVENVLRQQFRLTGLGTADVALATYATVAPDVLFLDINLPDVTGHELLTKIIQMDPNAYVIMLSGNADKENILKAMQNGAKGFVAKPFTKEKLFQYIERCPTIQKSTDRK